ncbi:hypothetical protein BJV74DRAFT_848466 [Russula compacta]|nr:hypothetical protein BJV74DRAFT_848466 [Russula compacta]
MIFVNLEGLSGCTRLTPPHFSAAYILILCLLAAPIAAFILRQAQCAGCHRCTCIHVHSVAQYGQVVQVPGARSHKQCRSAILHPCALPTCQHQCHRLSPPAPPSCTHSLSLEK